MKTYEAITLQEACKLAASQNSCLISDLEYNILQYPKKGIFGLFAKNAIIEITNIKNSNKKNVVKPPKENKKTEQAKNKNDEIVDSFFTKEATKESNIQKIDAKTLEEQIKKLFSYSCFEIDTIEVDIEDNTALIFIDGEDAALLIGKEGYRYNALSYMLFNWINVKYGLYIKLEIAQFLASQQDMIKNLLKPVIEHVQNRGNGKTKPLNGILVQIALEYLRDVFPDKYVAIKRNKDNDRYIIINNFNKK